MILDITDGVNSIVIRRHLENERMTDIEFSQSGGMGNGSRLLKCASVDAGNERNDNIQMENKNGLICHHYY
jgi:hypothetical protein